MKILSKGLVPLSVAAGAALFSILTGFISGVDPVNIMVRGFIAALLAAGFVFIAEWLVKTFLPELSNLNSTGSEEVSGPPLEGSRVNIVMPDEMPNPAQAAVNGASESENAGVGGDEGVLESLDESSSENEIAENTESVHNNKPEGPDSAAAAAGSLDTLPNLDSLEISIGSSGEDMAPAEALDSVTPSPSKGGTDLNLGENEDPEIIAKAVKTVLARDQQK